MPLRSCVLHSFGLDEKSAMGSWCRTNDFTPVSYSTDYDSSGFRRRTRSSNPNWITTKMHHRSRRSFLLATPTENGATQLNYESGPLDNIFLVLFRKKMAKEVGWDSNKPGYDGLIEVANFLMTKYRNKLDTEQATVRILRSLFPPFLLLLFRKLITPLGEGKPAAIMTARVTAATCQWLMGRSTVNCIDLPDGSSCNSGVLVEKCRYLEASKCAGICIHTCKLPTQTFIKEYMGIPLLMEPNFSDFSCQFKFGVEAPPACDDKSLHVPCLEICPNDAKRKGYQKIPNVQQCPKV